MDGVVEVLEEVDEGDGYEEWLGLVVQSHQKLFR